MLKGNNNNYELLLVLNQLYSIPKRLNRNNPKKIVIIKLIYFKEMLEYDEVK